MPSRKVWLSFPVAAQISQKLADLFDCRLALWDEIHKSKGGKASHLAENSEAETVCNHSRSSNNWNAGQTWYRCKLGAYRVRWFQRLPDYRLRWHSQLMGPSHLQVFHGVLHHETCWRQRCWSNSVPIPQGYCLIMVDRFGTLFVGNSMAVT